MMPKLKNMAKSKSFFGLRRGSTKSHTYQVFRGLQVTKDRVYDVKNPQSTAQMEQRLKLPMVANYVASLKDILNHSFEGVEYGEESLKYARQINLRKGALDITSYVPKGMMNAGVADFRVASGTLSQVGGNDGIYYNANADTSERYFAITSLQELSLVSLQGNLSSEPKNVIASDLSAIGSALFGVNVPDQLTIILCHGGNDYQWKASDGTDLVQPYNRYYIARLVFDTERFAENKGWKIHFVEEQDTSGAVFLTNGNLLLKFGPVAEKSTTVLKAGDSIKVMYSVDGTLDNTDDILMAASIVSDKQDGVWKRSNSWFQVNSQLPNTTYKDVIDTYLNASSTTESTKYLNAGSSAVDIPGGDTAV